VASGESAAGVSSDSELKKRLLTEPGDIVELALYGDLSDGLRSVILLYGVRGVPPTRSSDS